VESIEEKLLASLTEKFGGNPELSDGLAFIGVDSVGMAELTVEIEKDFGIRVKDDIVGVDTVQELADYIREQLDAHSQPSPNDPRT
jgi:acyl carrier protein